MCKGILIFMFYLIIVSAGSVFAEADKSADFCNKVHRIAVIATGSPDEVQFALTILQHKLPYGFKLYEVKDEKEAQQDKFCCILFLNYQKKTTETMWWIRSKASVDRIEIKLKTKNKNCSSNWENISEEGYRRPGPSSNAFDYEGQMAIDEIPKMEMSCAGCKGSLEVSLIDLLKDEDREVRKDAAVVLGRLGDIKAVEPLIDALKDEDREVRRDIIDILGKLGDIKAVEPLINALKDEDPIVRWKTADALGKIKDIRAVDPLIDTLKDVHSGVRWHASLALRSIQVSKTSMEEDYFGEDPMKWHEWWEKYKSKKN